jgi:hypothetical protein
MNDSQRPSVPDMLLQLDQAYRQLALQQPAGDADAQRLLTVLADFQWYAERLGGRRWEQPPRPGRWSLADNLWHIAAQAIEAARQPDDTPLRYFVDHGKEHVGQAAEILAIMSYDEGVTL